MTRGVKTVLTDEQLTQMGEYAFNGNQNGTIARLMGIAEDTIQSSKELQGFLRKKRCERKNWLLSQNKRIIESNQLGAAASVLIFTEKQSEHMGGLGFTDRPEDKSIGARPLVLIIGGDEEQIRKQIESQTVKPKEIEETDV